MSGMISAAFRRFRDLLATVAGAGLVGFAQASAYAANTIGATLQRAILGDSGRRLREVAFVLRNDGAGWSYINDVDHAPVGMGAISVVGDDLRTTYAFIALRVISLFGGPDETMSSRGLTFGPSVGLDYTNWRLFMPLAFWVDKNAGVYSFGNIDPWLGPGTDTTIATTDASRFTVNHKTASADMPPVASVLTGGAGNAPGLECRLSYGGNSIIGTFVEDMHGYIRWVGPTANDWVVETPNVAKPVCTFAAGLLTVVHEDIGDVWDTQITGVGGSIVITAGTPSAVAATRATSFTVTFQDYAGAAVNAANANMKLHYRRSRKVRTVPPDGTQVAVARGPVAVNPVRVVSTTGNIWVRGVLEVAP